MHLLYLTFGEDIVNHTQAQFSIQTFLAHKTQVHSINVVTDSPGVYTNLKPYINLIEVDAATLKKWKGEHDFFWRIKIKAIEMLCSMYKDEPVVYLDSDTFLYRDLDEVHNGLIQGRAYMHEHEGSLSKAKSKTEKKMWSQVADVAYGDLKIKASHGMWNAGVVATPNKKDNQECLLALRVCDEMCKQGVTTRLIEQFALSVALSEMYGLYEAKGAIAHYWSNKESWNTFIQNFFLLSAFNAFTLEQQIQHIKDLDITTLAVKSKKKNTNHRMKKLTDKLFPHQDLVFINRNQTH